MISLQIDLPHPGKIFITIQVQIRPLVCPKYNIIGMSLKRKSNYTESIYTNNKAIDKAFPNLR